MKLTLFAAAVLGFAFAEEDVDAFHMDEGHEGHDHGDGGTSLEIVETSDYHMMLEYYVEADQFGDKWLVFESTLAKESGTFENGQLISQWFQLKSDDSSHSDHEGHEDGDDSPHTEHEGHEDGDDSPHTEHEGHEDGDDSPEEFELVQATIKFGASDFDPSLQQTCGTKKQETFVNTPYTDRVEASDEASGCSPWLADTSMWESDEHDITVIFKRKLDEPQASTINLTGGSYSLRGGFFVTDANTETTGFGEGLELMIGESGAMARFMAGTALLIGAIAF